MFGKSLGTFQKKSFFLVVFVLVSFTLNALPQKLVLSLSDFKKPIKFDAVVVSTHPPLVRILDGKFKARLLKLNVDVNFNKNDLLFCVIGKHKKIQCYPNNRGEK